jgi:hypothetical protein
MEEEFHQHFNGLSFFSVLNVLWFVELKCGTHLQKVCHQLKQETTPASSECSQVNNSHQWMNCGQKKHSASVTARWLDSRKHYISPKRKGQQVRHTFEVFLSWTLKILILLSIQVCCCLKKHQAQAWALTISIAAVLYVANVLLYHANGRNAYVPYNPWWCLSGQEIIISYAMLQPQILQDSFLYCENNGSYVFYEAEEVRANQTTRCEHRALFIVVPWKATFQGWNLHWWLV